MIKANELRIGNLVLPKNPKRKDLEKISIVTAIDSTRVNRFFESNTSVSFYQIDDEFKDVNGQFIEFIEPIPITEEWLVKFGLEDEKHKGTYGFKFLDMYLSIYKSYGIFRILFEKADRIHNIRYVHTLQNLYFSLTGKELQYNP